MTINASFTIENTAGVAQPVVTQLLSLAQAAVDAWSAVLAGNATTKITISIRETTSSGRAEGGNETSAFLGTFNGNDVVEPGTAYELRTGLELGQAGNDIHITIARDYLLNELYLDATPATAGDIPSDRTDGLSVLMHEIGHGLGFIGYYDEGANVFSSNANTPYDTHVVLRGGEVYFDGANVRAVYGDAVPLTNNNYTHYGNTDAYPGTSTDPLTGLMNGVVYYRGYRYSISSLDLAILADNGIGTVQNDRFSIGLMHAFNGGAGTDTVDFAGTTAGVTVALNVAASQATGGAGDVTLVAIENVEGSRFADTLTGTLGVNRIAGGDGADVLYGLASNDVLTGGAGDDRLDGGAGIDTLTGGADDDTYVVENAGDVVIELAGQGVDTVIAGVAWTLGANTENLTLSGRARAGTGNTLDNAITGTTKADTLSGLGGRDTIDGGRGDDRIDGGTGNDILTGGRDKDVLTGGAGTDRFVFAKGDTGKTAASADTVADFSHAQHDKIDLSAIDAIAGNPGGDAFRFIGTSAFSGAAGELRYQVSGGDTLVSGDTDGDKTADLVIRLTGNIALVRGDFVGVTAALPFAAANAASFQTHADLDFSATACLV